MPRQPAVTGVALVMSIPREALRMRSAKTNGTRSSIPSLPVPTPTSRRPCATRV